MWLIISDVQKHADAAFIQRQNMVDNTQFRYKKDNHITFQVTPWNFQDSEPEPESTGPTFFVVNL